MSIPHYGTHPRGRESPVMGGSPLPAPLIAMPGKIAVLVDGGFARAKLRQHHKRHPTATDIEQVVHALLEHEKVREYSLYRVFYYDAAPYSGSITHPITGVSTNYATTAVSKDMTKLMDQIEMKENFALRKGVLLAQGWKLSKQALRKLGPGTTLTKSDIEPSLSQKGVDMRIGLDIASIATKHLVDAILLVTGDSDFVPAMKYARREGAKLILYSFDHGVVRDLKAHADILIPPTEIAL